MQLKFLSIESIRANPDQPRTAFDAEKLQHLSDSVKELGFVQPLVVREIGSGQFQLIAGERRLRAAKLAGLKEVPAIVKPHAKSAQEALAENLQRQDLNPIDVAKALQRLLANASLTQDKLSRQLGLNRSTLANYLRLLALPAAIQQMLQEGAVTMGHAKALAAIADPKRQLAMARQIARGKLSVRHVERTIKPTNAVLDRAAQELGSKLGTRVHITSSQIAIDYFSQDDLDRILSELGIDLC